MSRRLKVAVRLHPGADGVDLPRVHRARGACLAVMADRRDAPRLSR
jgi:hypothetical protein